MSQTPNSKAGISKRISSVKDAAITKRMFEQSLGLCVCVCERLAGLPVHSGTGITAAVKKKSARHNGSNEFNRLIITDDFHHVHYVFESVKIIGANLNFF